MGKHDGNVAAERSRDQPVTQARQRPRKRIQRNVPRGTTKGLKAWREVEEGFLTNQPTIPNPNGGERIPDPAHPPTEIWLLAVWRCNRTEAGIKRAREYHSLNFAVGKMDAALDEFLGECQPFILIAEQEPTYANYTGEPVSLEDTNE